MVPMGESRMTIRVCHICNTRGEVRDFLRLSRRTTNDGQQFLECKICQAFICRANPELISELPSDDNIGNRDFKKE